MTAQPGSVLCDCGKWITLTKAGLFREHRGQQWVSIVGGGWWGRCNWSGRSPEEQAAAHR